jgi:uncharacterized beta-barrel protein YwiB (DUF1934 family)
MTKNAWWFDASRPARRARVEVVREARDETGAYQREQLVQALDGWWHARGGAHYLRFDVTDPDTGTRTPTTLRIRPAEVALIRTGDQEWQQLFRPGVATTSRLKTASLLLPIEVTTHRLDVRVTPQGGSVRITFTQSVAGHTERVRLWVRFAELAEGQCDEPGEAKQQTESGAKGARFGGGADGAGV